MTDLKTLNVAVRVVDLVLASRDQQAYGLSGTVSARRGGMIVDQSSAGGMDGVEAV
jgi:hypothetical protein